ncbi:hypothetical protein CL629_02670 [bacterium]|nr:hypothetical protein [bacterium]|tara:strand:+ start:92 stop:325 length:234 start_codon:yes stop_codon:yes gene_type:complete
MPKRITYHVLPKPDGTWGVKKAKAKRMAFVSAKKPAVIRKAKSLAKKNKLGQVKIHDHHGKIEFEWTYGKDPERFPG